LDPLVIGDFNRTFVDELNAGERGSIRYELNDSPYDGEPIVAIRVCADTDVQRSRIANRERRSCVAVWTRNPLSKQ